MMRFTVSLEENDGFDKFLQASLVGGGKVYIEAKVHKKSKSWEQVKAIHKLCHLLIPRFSEAYGQKFDLESVKLALKLHLGYTRKATEGEILVEAINARDALKAMGISTSTTALDKMIKDLGRELIKPKSFAKATKEEMTELIRKIEKMAADMDWQEVKLTSLEKEEFKWNNS